MGHAPEATRQRGLRVVAVFEGAKGGLVLITGFGLLALSAFLYAVIRFIEAFGLWQRKRWAAWLGVLSGGVYVPVELFEVAHRLSWVKLGVLSVNLAIVAYLVYALTIAGRPPRNPSLPRSPRRSRKT